MEIEKLLTPSRKKLETIIDLCSQQQRVKIEVLKNHNDNLWWPLKLKDWRIRMLASGLSTRVSYKMIDKYIYVVNRLNEFTFDEIKTMPETTFREIVRPIGLQDSRVIYWQSIISFFQKLDDENIDPNKLSNEDFIELIQANVKGAGYKVAQCCVLYARGYYCGIMPIDSGMKDMLGLCIGFSYPKSGAISHEIFRNQLEALTKEIDCKRIASKNDYEDLLIPDLDYLTWWTHLVLIYFKRYFCNSRNYSLCPLRNYNNNELAIGKMCSKNHPEPGGHKLIIFEGIDGVGKTTTINRLLKFGYKLSHFNYNVNEPNLSTYYENILQNDLLNRKIFDRSFISERVYGKVLRGYSRINDEEYIELLKQVENQRGIIVYLHLEKEQLLRRVNVKDENIIQNHYDEICSAYNEELSLIENYVPLIKLKANNTNLENLYAKLDLK